jgi:Cellulase (glycosyl hydrolase family 5)
MTKALRFTVLIVFFMLVACAMVAPTSEATPAPTPKATPAPTPEATPAPTPEATAAPTPEATPAPAPEAIPAPTPEATLGDDASVFNPFLKAVDQPMGAPSREALWDVYNRFYQAVRAIDPDHIITLEGCADGQWGLHVLPDPKPRGWTNVVYQIHAYEFPPDPVPPGWDDLQKQKDESDSIIDDIVNHQDWHVPCLVGEFNCMGQPKAWEYTISHYQDNHVNWTIWTYKATHGTPRVQSRPRVTDLEPRRFIYLYADQYVYWRGSFPLSGL